MKIDDLTEAVKAYHGSSEKNPNFRIGHTGYNTHTFGGYTSKRYGVFFSTNPKFAAIYGEVGEYRLNLRRTLNLEKDRGKTIHEFIESLDPFDPTERPIWMTAKYIRNVWQMFEDDVGKRFVEFLKELGYDSASFIEYNEDDNGKEIKSNTIVVLDPSKIKKIS